MQTRTSLLAKSTSLLGATVALLFASQAAAQVTFTQDFNANSTGWTGNFTRTATATCAGQSMRKNQWASATTALLVSPSTGTALGGNVVTLNYDYKCYNFTGGGATVAPWGSFVVEYGPTATGPWTNIATITDEAQVLNTCLAKSHNFTPPAGPLFVRWSGTRTGGDYWLAFDNVSVVENVPCPTPAPGNTVGPADACPGANFTLSLQNSTGGQTVSYQWYASTVSASGPWTPVGTNLATYSTSQTVDSWYYCDVTCSVGPVTTASNVLAVPMSAPTFPQAWSTGVVAPNCWAVSGLVGASLPDYNAVSAFGVGTGSVRFNFFGITALNQPTLTSPTFAPLTGSPIVSFDVAGAAYTGGEVDQIVLEESNDGGTTWTAVVTMDNSVGGQLNTLGGAQAASFVPTAAQWASLQFPLAVGTDRIRFRGVSDFGNSCFLDNVNITPGVPAYHQTIGTGCYSVDNPSTLGELFASAAAAKSALDGNSLSFTNTGNGYLALFNVGGGAAYVAPVTPTVHAVGDEGSATITPSTATPSPNGPITQWTIHGNGALTAGAVSNPAGFLSTFASLGTAPNLGFWSFHDYNEATAGQVVSEEVGNMTYVTFDAVAGFGQATDLSTFQFQINRTTGDVSIVWVSMHAVDIELNFAGATLAGVEAAPASSTLSTVTPFLLLNDQLPMVLSAVGAPINGGPAPTYTVSNLPEYFPGAGFSTLAIVFGFTVFPGGIDLGPGPFDIGAPGCNGYTTPDVIVIIGVVPFAPASFPIAWNIPGTPGTLYMQAVSEFLPNTLPNGQNAGGKIVSNALEIYIENF